MANFYGSATPTLTDPAFVEDPGPMALATRLEVAEPGQITAVRYYVANSQVSSSQPTISLVIWGDDTTTPLYTASGIALRTTPGWQVIPLTTPLDVAPGNNYMPTICFDAAAAVYYGAESSATAPKTANGITIEAWFFIVGGSYKTAYPVNQTTNDYKIDVEFAVPGPLAPTAATLNGFTATGGTALAVLGDSQDSTYVEATDPNGSTITVTLPPITPPPGDLTMPIRATVSGGAVGVTASYSVNAGASWVTTSASLSLGLGGPVDKSLVIPAADISAITSAAWATGVQVRLTFTAS